MNEIRYNIKTMHSFMLKNCILFVKMHKEKFFYKVNIPTINFVDKLYQYNIKLFYFINLLLVTKVMFTNQLLIEQTSLNFDNI